MKVDLHCHSSASDGSLSPAALLQLAESENIDILSITDHDTMAAYAQLKTLTSASLTLVPGIEFSTRWQKVGIHIVGLNIQLDSDAIHAGVHCQHQARSSRAQHIAEKLEKLGIEDAWESVKKIAGDSVIGRPHFARFLVDSGVVKDMNQAFTRYLGAGRAGDVKQYWAPFGQIIQWIRDAGGIAVLAHPQKYKLTRSKLMSLLHDFRAAGGESMEVISGRQSSEVTSRLVGICRQNKLLASCGSDFHQPGQAASMLGAVAALPLHCRPVWDNWH